MGWEKSKTRFKNKKKILLGTILLTTFFLTLWFAQSNTKNCDNDNFDCFKNAIIICTPGITTISNEPTVIGEPPYSTWKSTIIGKVNGLCKVEIRDLTDNSKEDCYYRIGGTTTIGRHHTIDNNDPNSISIVYCDNNT